jgi:hypothetical protein
MNFIKKFFQRPIVVNITCTGPIQEGDLYVLKTEIALTPTVMEAIRKSIATINEEKKAKFIVIDGTSMSVGIFKKPQYGSHYQEAKIPADLRKFGIEL